MRISILLTALVGVCLAQTTILIIMAVKLLKYTPRPPVLAKDGLPIEIGQTLWCSEESEYRVIDVGTKGAEVRWLRGGPDDECHFRFISRSDAEEFFTHKKPSTDKS